VDAIRRRSREQARAAHSLDEGDDADALFRDDGHWVEHPASWNNPDASLTQKQFFAVLEECLKKLPAKTAQVFMMREHLGSETEEICKELSVTPTHCWVLLYRARMALQQCLDRNWFGK
jgi:RNA polymerase sigma-70 factor (ECF subfamily)